MSNGAIAGIVVGSVIVVFLVIFVPVWMKRKKRVVGPPNVPMVELSPPTNIALAAPIVN
jgi:hypothetical protein